MKKQIYFIITSILFTGLASGQTVLDQYIQESLQNNIALQLKKHNYEKEWWGLKEARSMFFPLVEFNARYSLAEGGRIIELPIHDIMSSYSMYNNLLNPSLNLQVPDGLTNEEFPFLRPTEHETKIRLVQPILNTDIYYQQQIKKNQLNIAKYDVKSYENELVFLVKEAYFNHLKAAESYEIYVKTKDIISEFNRVTGELYDNQKLTRDHVYRGESELAKIEQQIAEAEKMKKVSAAYFNFLLNRPLEEPIIRGEEYNLLADIPELDSLQTIALEERNEMNKMKEVLQISERNIQLNKTHLLPNISAIVDYGFQGEKYKFTGDDDFIMASFVLSWKIFHGFENQRQTQQAKILKKESILQQESLEKAILLEVKKSWYDLEAAFKAVQSAKKETIANVSAFRIVHKKYAQDQVTQLEFL
ncbi:MAG: TolC family protein, partial [Bacteroidota bacterium]